jgi:hypothetical protein
MHLINLSSKSKEQQKFQRTSRKTWTIFWAKVFELLSKFDVN